MHAEILSYGNSRLRGFQKRTALRTTLALPVSIITCGSRHNALLCNLSKDGAMIETSASLTVREKIELHCGTIVVGGRVVWRNAARIGVKFDQAIGEHQVKAQIARAVAITDRRDERKRALLLNPSRVGAAPA